ncbi:MAG: tRNA-queuosine alpha-mannosyltransferase domain-containing protein [Acidimicrobiales bacterium]
MKVVVCEPWLGGSHGAWAAGLAHHSAHDVTVIGLPDRAWRWRLRASAPWLAEQIQRHGSPDLVIASSLTDASVLRALIGLDASMVLYMHESQAAYPTGEWDLDSATRNWQSMLAVDEVWFNSAFHLDVALEEVERLQAAMPTEQRVTTVGWIEEKSRVVYPGVDLTWIEPKPARSGPPVILWPHRWNGDKNPQVFERAVQRLTAAGLDFGLVLAGTDSKPPSEVRQRMIDHLDDHVLAVGPFDIEEYRRWVLESDIVVSCTGHEFFGIAVVEALAAGCRPVLPNGFSYPEIVTGQVELYEPSSFGSALERAVRHVDLAATRIDLSRFDWRNRIEDYDARISRLVSR